MILSVEIFPFIEITIWYTPVFLKSSVGSLSEPVLVVVDVVTGRIAPEGVRTLTTTLLPFFRAGRATDKFFEELIVMAAFLATDNAVRFCFEVVVER